MFPGQRRLLGPAPFQTLEGQEKFPDREKKFRIAERLRASCLWIGYDNPAAPDAAAMRRLLQSRA
jgi:hypothetical protein